MRLRTSSATAFVLLLLTVTHAVAQSAPPTRSVLRETEFIGRSVLSGLAAPLDWSAHDWLRLGAGAAALAAVSFADAGVRDLARRNRGAAGDDIARAAKPFGRAGSAVIVVGFLAGGVVFDDSHARAVAIDAIAASVLTSALIVPALQLAVGRSRPWRDDGSHAFEPFGGGHSFPSGHAGQAFAVASVVAAHYDAGWVDAVAWSGAGLVAASRIYHDAHHLSDVAASALIATAVGRSIVRKGRAERGFSLQPAIDPRTIGFTMKF